MYVQLLLHISSLKQLSSSCSSTPDVRHHMGMRYIGEMLRELLSRWMDKIIFVFFHSSGAHLAP